MNVKYVFGPNAGQTCHVPRDQFIDILIKSGVLEIAADEPVRQPVTVPTPRWSIFVGPTTGQPAIQCAHQRGVEYYSGKPENAHKFKVGNSTPPQEVIAAYAAELERRTPLEKWREDSFREFMTTGPWKETEENK
jgi:hypothetical protein